MYIFTQRIKNHILGNKIENNYKTVNILHFLNKTVDVVKSSIVKFSSTSIAKYINNNTDYSVYFLRKNKKS